MDSSGKTVSDLETLKAIAHPLRMGLLAALREHGPATASELGRRLGESSGSASYHLRQLERYGFVADDDAKQSRRERRWKAVHRQTDFRTEGFGSDVAAQALMRAATGHSVDYLMENVGDYLRGGLAPEWEPVLGINDWLLRLTPEDAAELMDRIQGLLADFASRESDSPDARPVAWHVLALPRRPQ
ncbi:winged helix-turn-helix domain-containing protein [Arthrobacter sp. HY1533]|uniref:winged helix-turn-helix domain-containing protein n=1 Tax=Arthrobacter sp. HY1533 TaxID=2970919 RepID=UPI0022B9E6E8|nr:helix-turn-helix domain-containing protein [Arthrobacter sp. HY1533]